MQQSSPKTAFCFDLDGTITKQEILPLLSKEIGLFEEIGALTEATIKGVIPFKKSFLLRCRLLADIPVSRVQEIISAVPVYKELWRFIEKHREDCFVITGNLDVWIGPLLKKLGCHVFSSTAEVDGDKLSKVSHVLNKGEAVASLRSRYERIIAVGDGMGDVQMFEKADVTIAFGGTHPPIDTLQQLANFVTFSPTSLERLLNSFALESSDDVVAVISAAGLGSRLELNRPKCLVTIGENRIIDYQLSLLEDFKEIRIVVGFLEDHVIEYVKRKRPDVLFVRNPYYRTTSNSFSLHLASKDIQGPFLSVDGDLIISPESFSHFVKQTACSAESIVGITKAKTEEAVFVTLDNENNVTGFSLTDKEAYEWAGLAYLNGITIHPNTGFVFKEIEKHLPLPAQSIDCYEVDTQEDLANAVDAVKNFTGFTFGNGTC